MKALVLAIVGLVVGTVSARSLPDRLTDAEFWRLTVELSEPDGPFIADNFVSNERSFAQTIPQIAEHVAPGRAYIGVGPEQNFSFITTARPGIAFVIDIRRDNYRLQLLYKAVFAISSDRSSFLSHLFARDCRVPGAETVSAAALIAACDRASPPPAQEGATDRAIRSALASAPAAALSEDDWTKIDRIHGLFRQHGSRITYALTPSGEPIGTYGFAAQVTQMDAARAEFGFLASEAHYRVVRDLQSRNLIVPIVGNFAGPKALRAVGAYLRRQGGVLGAFYVSNVEDYLGRVPSRDFNNGSWQNFCANVATMPLDQASVFVRPYGLSAYDASGTLMVNRELSITGSRDRDGTLHPPGATVTMPASLFLIRPELKACEGK